LDGTDDPEWLENLFNDFCVNCGRPLDDMEDFICEDCQAMLDAPSGTPIEHPLEYMGVI